MDGCEDCGVAMQLTLTINGQAVEAAIVQQTRDSVTLELNGTQYHFCGAMRGDGSFVLDQELADNVWRRQSGAITKHKQHHDVQLGALTSAVAAQKAGAVADEADALSPSAPMPGLVRSVLVKKGDKVSAGQTVAVMEAMKLQLNLHAGGDGVVAEVLAKEGDMLAEGDEVIRITAGKK